MMTLTRTLRDGVGGVLRGGVGFESEARRLALVHLVLEPRLQDAREFFVGRAEVIHDDLFDLRAESAEGDDALASRADAADPGRAGGLDGDLALDDAPVGDVVRRAEALREGRGAVRALRPRSPVDELRALVPQDRCLLYTSDAADE